MILTHILKSNKNSIQTWQKALKNHFIQEQSKKLSKLVTHKEFNGLTILKKNYKVKVKINSNFEKDAVTMYKN